MHIDAPLPYLQRIKDWYLALGYAEPYRWHQQQTVAFTPLTKPVTEITLGIVTTAAPVTPSAGDQGPGAAYNGKAKFLEVYAAPTDTPPELGVSHIAIDRAHTTAEDTASFFPLAAFQHAVAAGQLGQISKRFYGLPTDRSVRRTRESFAPAVLSLCQEDTVDAVVLVPNCPVCHQSVAITANLLEAAGVPTVIMGCALDIIEHVGAPRLLFNDLPLGNAAGPPGDSAAQDSAALKALQALADATAPRTTVRSDLQWPGAADWKKDYSNPALLTEHELADKRAEFERVKRERDDRAGNSARGSSD